MKGESDTLYTSRFLFSVSLYSSETCLLTFSVPNVRFFSLNSNRWREKYLLIITMPLGFGAACESLHSNETAFSQYRYANFLEVGQIHHLYSQSVGKKTVRCRVGCSSVVRSEDWLEPPGVGSNIRRRELNGCRPRDGIVILPFVSVLAQTHKDNSMEWHHRKIRRTFLDFFVNHPDLAHREVASSPIIPPDDPTLLFTNAGMNQSTLTGTGKAGLYPSLLRTEGDEGWW